MPDLLKLVKLVSHMYKFINSPALSNVNYVISCHRFDRIAHTRETMASDGINSLTYNVVKIEKDLLFTKITVDVGKP